LPTIGARVRGRVEFREVAALPFARYPSLRDRVVFITGGGSGIGAAMVEAFVGQGASVAFVDIDREASLAVVERLAAGPQPPLFLECDLTNLAALETAMEEVRQRLGPIAALINNAANDARQDADEITEADWDAAMAVNLKHQFFAAQIARRSMRERGGGSIVNLSSTAWMNGYARLAAYSIAKAAVVGMTHALAREFGPDNIRVNAVAPGTVFTERQRRLWFPKAQDVTNIVARQSLSFALQAEDVARVALFLAADDSRAITKQCLIVDAGER
jgi:NAD(P)-dependent dehydrogenase (short-subunit alcohol dehydrogenase family)